MLDLTKYNEEFKEKLREQLAVYVIMGTPKIESPMWFQYNQINGDCESFYFQSSQVDYMFFNIPVKKEDKESLLDATGIFHEIYNHFRDLKYSFIKECWPTVYYELRPNEKPIEPVTAKKIENADREIEITDYQKQANDFLKATNTTFASSYKKHDFYFDGDKDQRDIYNCVLKNASHRFRFTFGQSIANTGTHPTTYDVLACLTKYDVGTFENFCSDFGYDTDSRKAYKIYKAVLREWKNIELLFTPEQIEQLQEIE